MIDDKRSEDLTALETVLQTRYRPALSDREVLLFALARELAACPPPQALLAVLEERVRGEFHGELHALRVELANIGSAFLDASDALWLARPEDEGPQSAAA